MCCGHILDYDNKNDFNFTIDRALRFCAVNRIIRTVPQETLRPIVVSSFAVVDRRRWRASGCVATARTPTLEVALEVAKKWDVPSAPPGQPYGAQHRRGQIPRDYRHAHTHAYTHTSTRLGAHCAGQTRRTPLAKMPYHRSAAHVCAGQTAPSCPCGRESNDDMCTALSCVCPATSCCLCSRFFCSCCRCDPDNEESVGWFDWVGADRRCVAMPAPT